MISSILVEQEQSSIRYLENQILQNCPNVAIKGFAYSLKNAAKLIDERKPDLIFSNTIINEESGFELFKYTNTQDFEVIYISDEKQAAIEAMKRCAIGYIKKAITSTKTNAQKR